MIDIDAHHGNGTEAIFAPDPAVLTGSVHVDPGAGWFPHFLGFRTRTERATATSPSPRAPATSPALDERDRAARGMGSRERRPGAPWSRSGSMQQAVIPRAPLDAVVGGYGEAGRILGELSWSPDAVFVQGGYVLETVGDLVVATLRGLSPAGADEPPRAERAEAAACRDACPTTIAPVRGSRPSIWERTRRGC